LNNVHSGVIKEMMNTDSYINTAAWGLRISQIFSMTKSLLEDYNPQTVILAANVIDYYPPEIKLDVKEITDFIRSGSPIKYQYKYFETDYFFRRLYTNRRNFNTNEIYMSLNFDANGGVLLQKKDFEKNNERWKKSIHFEPVKQENYLYLDSMASMLSSKGIELIYVQTPIRSGMLDNNYSNNISNHVNRLNTILDKYPNTFFIDATKRRWEDSLFVDVQHFNSIGAKEFTRYFIKEYLNVKELK